MIKHVLWIAVIVVLFIAYLLWDSRGVTRNPNEITEIEMNLVKGRCTQAEMINRHFLQQSWFHDNNYSELAGAFGQYSFSLYQQENTNSTPIEGAFCIEGKNLRVRYYKRRFVPVSINISEWSIQFDAKLKALREDTFTVKELNQKRMVLLFSSDGNEHVFYRKN